MASGLNLYQDGSGEDFLKWLVDKGSEEFPGIGTKTYRVPPVRFNNQKLIHGKKQERDYKVLDLLAETDIESNKAENLVCGAFEDLSRTFQDKGEPAMFIITNFEYDNYLNKVDLSARDTLKPGCTSSQKINLPKDVRDRGELDMMVLHQQAGILLLQNKAVGYNFGGKNIEENCQGNIETAVTKAGEQLLKDRRVMLHVMGDLELCDEQLTSVIALPNLSRDYVNMAVQSSATLYEKLKDDFKLSLDVNFLCAEDFNSLLTWWTERLLPVVRSEITLDLMKQVAFRTVGLLSTVSVWTFAQPRVEVRDMNDAAWETGHRYAQIVLSPHQAEILKMEEQYVYVWGAAGTGKTLLLSFKGRQWLKRNFHVVILNTRLGSKGRDVGRVIYSMINKSKGLPSTAQCIDLDLGDGIDYREQITRLKTTVPTSSRLGFLFDEVTWMHETEEFLDCLKNAFPSSSIWCVGMFQDCCPSGFTSATIQKVLRCPTSVQRVLKLVDDRKERRVLYHNDSATVGLSTDGPKPFFIIHSQHGQPGTQPFDCKICAQKLATFLKEDLKISNENIKPKNKQKVNENKLPKCYSSKPDGELLQKDFSEFGFQQTTKHISVMDFENSELKNISDETNEEKFRSRCSKEDKPYNNDSGFNSPLSGSTKSENGETKENLSQEVTINDLSNENQYFEEFKNQNKVISSKNIHQNNGGIFGTNTKHSEKESNRENNQSHVNKNTFDLYQDSSKSQPEIEIRAKNTEFHPEATVKDSRQNSPIYSVSEIDYAPPIDSKRLQKKRRSYPHRKPKKLEQRNSVPEVSLSGSGLEARIRNSAPLRPRLDYRNVTLPVTMPQTWHRHNLRGYWSLSRDALAQNMILYGSRKFFQELQRLGVPIKIEQNMRLTEHASSSSNSLIICPLGAVHGLEYKVVICSPSFCELPEETELNEGVLEGKDGPKVKMKRTEFGTYLQKLKTDSEIQRKLSLNPKCSKKSTILENESQILDGRAKQKVFKNSNVNNHEHEFNNDLRRKSIDNTDKYSNNDMIRFSTHVEGDSSDVLYKRNPQINSDEMFPENLDLNESFNNVDIKKTSDSSVASCKSNSFLSHELNKKSHSLDKICSEVSDESNNLESDQDLGLLQSQLTNLSFYSSNQQHKNASSNESFSKPEAIRLDHSTSPSGPQEIRTPQTILTEQCPKCGVEDCVCRYFTEAEIKLLQSLSPWDKSYVLMVASRCTSQLILILP